MRVGSTHGCPPSAFDAFDRLYTGRSRTAEVVSRILVSTAERSLCR